MKFSFEWDPVKDTSNQRKHGLAFRQAATVFRDQNQLSIYDEEHSQDEERWITLGIDSFGGVRVVVHTFEQINKGLCSIRIISARKATRSEVNQYEAGKE